MATIDRMLVSWTLSSTLPAVIRGGRGLARRASYADAFSTGRLGAVNLAPPWRDDPERSRYWRATVPNADASGAWEKQVPLKGMSPAPLATDVAGIALRVERYAHPGGASISVNGVSEGAVEPDEALEVQRRLARDPVVVDDAGGRHSVTATLHWLLDQWEAELLGDDHGVSERDDQPTIITTITGTSEPFTPAAATDLLRRFCYPGEPPGWTEVLQAKSGKGNDSLRIAGSNSRAIWSPARASADRHRRSLECYHSNQVRGALHTNQLLGVVSATSNAIHLAPDSTQELARRAAINIRWLHGSGDVKVYHSGFTRARIDESGVVPTLNELATTFSLGPGLSTPAPRT
ncbi:hypothetical protein ACLQ2Q_13340 [Microbacterium sp. DT81.1]|uniref:hypothetical protein n=1 Tax=Microbacterium sp. DT81.1 TaxID=3393413 RepID=UPI003CE7FB41